MRAQSMNDACMAGKRKTKPSFVPSYRKRTVSKVAAAIAFEVRRVAAEPVVVRIHFQVEESL